jgi:oligo-1,6-glucosidase
MTKNWWKESIVYQIYPRSFKDANGDGIGDLPGIISELDYLADLGVDVLWLSPFFKSPNADNGYDISDYRDIMPEFGTMTDFDQLLQGVHQRGMKLIMDLVVNHSSDEHFWFQESKKSKDNPYRDYYIWQPPRLGENGERLPPNDWCSFFSGPAWEWDEQTGEYYLHLFAKKQPDLNWENPRLRQEVYDLMHFWLQKGIDGFRMDVIAAISKDTTFPNFPEGRYGDLTFYANGPRLHEFLREMHEKVLRHYDCMTIGEGFGVSVEQANLFVGEDRRELNMIYHFDHAVPRYEHCFLQPEPEFTLPEIKAIFGKWEIGLGENGWQNTYFGNHDNPRVLSRLGDPAQFHYESATMLALILLTQRGTIGMYQGDEIGMTNCPFDAVTEYNDLQVLNAYQALIREKGGDEAQFLAVCNRIARDHARTPMQWRNAPNAGFTTGSNTWLKVNPNFTTINAETDRQNPRSVWHFYQQLIRFRRQNPTLVYGKYRDLLPEHAHIYAFTRTFEGAQMLMVGNFSGEYQPLALPPDIQAGTWGTAISNYTDETGEGIPAGLRPFEARILVNTGPNADERTPNGI